MVVAALQPWAQISERLRRIVDKFQPEALPPLRSLAGFHARARLVRSLRQPDFNVGLVEDLVAIGQSVHRFEILVQRPIPLTNESRVAVKHLKSQFVTASDNP